MKEGKKSPCFCSKEEQRHAQYNLGYTPITNKSSRKQEYSNIDMDEIQIQQLLYASIQEMHGVYVNLICKKWSNRTKNMQPKNQK